MSSTTDRPSKPPSQGGSRAFTLGFHPGILAGVALIALAAVLALVLAGGGASPTARARISTPRLVNTTSNLLFKPTSTEKRGGVPSWLPRPKVKTNRIVIATLTRPQVGIEGDTIHVMLAQGTALATAVGPEVPEEGHFPVPHTTPTAFVVTFASIAGRIPLSAGEFTLLDETGVRHHPHVTTINGGSLPAFVPAGRPFSIRLHAILATGSGSLTWTPVNRPLVSWDFDVEID